MSGKDLNTKNIHALTNDLVKTIEGLPNSLPEDDGSNMKPQQVIIQRGGNNTIVLGPQYVINLTTVKKKN